MKQSVTLKSLTNTWPAILHIILVPVFFILHNVIDFSGLVHWSNLASDILMWLLLPPLVFLLSIRIFSNTNNAALFTLIVNCAYFFTVPLYTVLHLVPYVGFVFKLSILMLAAFLGCIAAFLLLRRRTTPALPRLHRFATICLLFLIAYDLIQAAAFSSSTLKPGGQQTMQLNSNKLPAAAQLPDIYYFLFDMHPSTDAVREILGYDNSELDSSLQQLGFAVIRNSTSACNYTLPSMASVFQGTQPYTAPRQQISFREKFIARQQIIDNPFVPFLQSKGYQIVNASPFPLFPGDTSNLQHPGWGVPEDLIRNQTFIPRILHSYNWLLATYLPQIFRFEEEKLFAGDLKTIDQAFVKTDQAIHRTDTAKPAFVYAHLLLPHEGFKFDSLGNQLKWNKETMNGERYNEQFISQLAFCRKKIQELAKTILHSGKRASVIIFQGDHGIREPAGNNRENMVFEVFNALYLPGQQAGTIPPGFYTPNTFRLLSNFYFGHSLPLLEAKHSYLELR